MGHEFDRYEITPGYMRPDRSYDPSKPSSIEGYSHPPKPHYKYPEWEERDWNTVYSRLDPATQDNLRETNWYADYSRLSDDVRIKIEELVLDAVTSFPNHDLVSALSDRENIHRYDVVGAITQLHSKEQIEIVNIEGVRGLKLKTVGLKAGEPIALTSSAA